MIRITLLVAGLFLSLSTPAHANEAQIQCLAKGIYHEARGEPIKGKVAVGNVVMNRVESGKFPKTPCGVINQRSSRGCQFSWVCTRNRVKDLTLYKESVALARKIYYRELPDYTGGATYFHSRKIKPAYSRGFIKTAVIGGHSFYRG